MNVSGETDIFEKHIKKKGEQEKKRGPGKNTKKEGKGNKKGGERKKNACFASPRAGSGPSFVHLGGDGDGLSCPPWDDLYLTA